VNVYKVLFINIFMKYSVGIPVRNEFNSIEDTINSVLNQTIVPDEVLVCVNGSTDGTLDLVTRISKESSKIKLIESDPGKPNAWHEIYNNSKNNYLMMADGDVLVNDLAAETFLNIFDEKIYLAIVTGSETYIKPKKLNLFQKLSTENFNSKIRPPFVSGRLYMMDKSNYSSVANVANCDMMPREVINEDMYVGLLSNHFNKLGVTHKAYSLAKPLQKFSEWFSRTKRIVKGNTQMSILCPNLSRTSSTVGKNDINYFMKRFIDSDNIVKGFGSAGFFVLRKMIEAKYSVLGTKDFNNLWDEQSSTKIVLK
jgi:glycosyltransferase involved in cell wall biosynthesis